MTNEQELNRFLQSNEARAYRAAYIATGNRDDALDITQSAMLKLVQSYRHKPSEEWGPLFTTILHSTITDWHRKGKWRSLWVKITGGSHEDDDEIDGLETYVADPSPAFEHTLDHQRALQRLETALNDLPLRQRQAFLLRLWDGFDVAQTAQAMKCSPGSVKTHLSRALKTVQAHLGEFRDE